MERIGLSQERGHKPDALEKSKNFVGTSGGLGIGGFLFGQKLITNLFGYV